MAVPKFFTLMKNYRLPPMSVIYENARYDALYPSSPDGALARQNDREIMEKLSFGYHTSTVNLYHKLCMDFLRIFTVYRRNNKAIFCAECVKPRPPVSFPKIF